MKLTAQQEKFAQAIADGMTQADAYRHAYDCSKTKTNVIHVNASKVAAIAKVALRVESLKAALSEMALWTRQDSVKTLKSIADGLGSGSKPNEVVSAVKELNAMHGFNEATKHELSMFFPKVINVIAGRA